MCPTPDGFRDRDMDIIARIKERQEALRRTTRHVLTRVAKCIDGDGGVFETVLY
jgi:phosphate uptake regulator